MNTIKKFITINKLAKRSKENLDKAFEDNNKKMEVLLGGLKKYDK